jgi:hypothetical protein
MSIGGAGGIGVDARSGSGGVDLFAQGTGRIRQLIQASNGAPTSGSFGVGEQIRDSLGDLYICTASGSPGTWRQVFTSGGINTSANTTVLVNDGGPGPNPLLNVDNSFSTNGGGIMASANGSGNGIYGFSPSGLGVRGASTSNTGTYGVSSSGFGVVGASGSSIDLAAAGTGRFQQVVQSSTGAPTSGFYSKGEQVRDVNGDLYICVATGSPGTWKKVAAIPAGKLGGALVFLPKPFRIFDTRPGVAGCPIDPATPMTFPQVITLQVTGTPSTIDSSLVVPTGATGIIGDLLAINVVGNGVTVPGSGFLTLQPHNVTPTTNSFLHYYPTTVQHNSVVIGLDAAGKLDVGNYNATTNVGLDILGYII